MTNTNIKRYSTSYIIREMQIETMSYYYVTIRMTKFQDNDNTKYWQECRAINTLINYQQECKMRNHFGRQFDNFLNKILNKREVNNFEKSKTTGNFNKTKLILQKLL